MTSARGASPDFGECSNGSCENNSANKDGTGVNRDGCTTNRAFTKVCLYNNPYSVVWSLCGWKQRKSREEYVTRAL